MATVDNVDNFCVLKGRMEGSYHWIKVDDSISPTYDSMGGEKAMENVKLPRAKEQDPEVCDWLTLTQTGHPTKPLIFPRTSRSNVWPLTVLQTG
jgi:hypothetical protein